MSGLPAGRYRIAAVPGVEPRAWFDPVFLESIVPASPIMLADGERKIQDFQMAAR